MSDISKDHPMPPELRVAQADLPSVTAEVETVAVPMTAEKARQLTDRMKTSQDNFWEDFLEIAERKGWKTLNYKSMEEYAAAELAISGRHYFRRLSRLRIERELGLALGSMPERQAREIKKLNEPEKRKDAYESARSMAADDGGVVEQRHVEAAVDEALNGLTHGSSDADGDSGEAVEDEVRTEADYSDDEWLDAFASGSVRETLTDRLRAGYERDALLYRRAMGAKESLANTFRLHAKSNTQGVRAGLYQQTVQRFLQTSHPASWLVCPHCKGTPKASVSCFKCKDRGYVYVD